MFDNLHADILAPLALILASPFFLLSAFKQRRRRLYFHHVGISVDGIVIRIDEKKGADDEYTSYEVIIGFMVAGQEWVTSSYNSDAFSSFKTGQFVSILYSPEDYTNFIILTDEKPWIEFAFGVVGAIILISGGVWLASLG